VKQSNKNPFKGRQFTAETILWAVRWYLQFPISYRDLERMFSDRGIQVDHTTLFRWIQAYAPELETRIRLHLHVTNGSWIVCVKFCKAGRPVRLAKRLRGVDPSCAPSGRSC
jgi:transposase, IS6 family